MICAKFTNEDLRFCDLSEVTQLVGGGAGILRKFYLVPFPPPHIPIPLSLKSTYFINTYLCSTF